MNVREVSDLELEKAAATGDLDVLRSVDVTRLRRFKHSRWSKAGLLDVAIDHQQAGVVRWLVQTGLESGVDVAAGWTMGHAASFAGDLEVLTGLSEEALQARSDSGNTLVHAAALGGCVNAIELLVDMGVDPKAARKDGYTTIHSAASNGHVAAIDRLVELEVNPKATSNNGWTTIHAAALSGHVGAIDRLVELGVDPKATMNDGWTTIHAAAENGHVAAIERLVALGVDPKATKKNGWTPIHAAALNGHVAAIERLVELEVDPKATRNDGVTTIHAAAENGHVAAIDRLVELGVDPKATMNDGWTTIHAAAANGHVAAIDRLVELEVNPKATKKTGYTTIHAAAENGHVAAIERLVALGVDPKATKKNGWTPIHAAALNGHVAAIERLVELEVDPKATWSDGFTTIHAAAENGHVAAIDQLVELGVDPKATKKNGWTPIHAAALNGLVATIERLAELGVDPKATRNDGVTTIHAAVENGHVAAIDRLVELGVDPKATMNDGWTTIHAAAANGHVAAIDRLVELGVDPKATMNDGWTTIHAAAANGHVAAIDRLVELEVNPKATRNDGCTTIHAAAENGHVAAIERLVDLGVDPKATKKDGWTTIHDAALNGHVAAIDRLVDLGVDPKATTDKQQNPLHTAAKNGQTAAAAFLLHLGVDATARTKDGRTALQWAVERHHDGSAALLRHSHGWLVLADDMPAELLSVDELPVIPALRMLVALGPMTKVRLASVLLSPTCLHSLEALALRGLDSAGVHRLSTVLAGCRKLHRLDLSSSTFDNMDLMESCVSLTSLSLAGCVLSSANLDTIAALPHLRRLVLSGAKFDSLDPLAAGCRELRFLDVAGCGLPKAPTFLVPLPELEQLVMVDNPFVDGLQEYAQLLADPAVAVDFLRTLALSSEGKTRDVPVVLVGHGRAGKSQVLRGLLREQTWMSRLPDVLEMLPGVMDMLPGMVDMLPGVVERVPVVTERTSMVESDIHSLQMSAPRRDSFAKRSTDHFEARFFDTPGQMEFFASNMMVLAPLFSSCVVLCVARCVSHGVLPQDVSFSKEKVRIERQFRLWLAEVSRAVVGAHQSKTTIDQAVPLSKRASVMLVVTHRDVLENTRGQEVVARVEMWLQSLAKELRAEFEATLVVHGSALFVNATVASVRGGGVAPLREQLEILVHSRFVHSPTLPEVLVDARAFIASDEVRQRRIIERSALEELVSTEFGEGGLTLRLLRQLLEVLETNGSVLRTPAGRLVVVDPSWISRVISSLYVNPQKRDAGEDELECDALAAFEEAGEVLADDLERHLAQFVDGEDGLLERLLRVLVSNAIVIPLRLSALKLESGKQQTGSYLIVGRWMSSASDTDDDGSVEWSSGCKGEASWFELVTGVPFSPESAASVFGLSLDSRGPPAFRIASLRCSSHVPMGPSFLTWLVYRLSVAFKSSKHSFTVRRNGFVCVLPFTRFQAVHVQLPASGSEFDLTVVALPEDAAAALSFVLLEAVFPVLDTLSLVERSHWLSVRQRCSGCVATRSDLSTVPSHKQGRVLAAGVEVRDTEESVRALCDEVFDSRTDWRVDECRGADGVLSRRHSVSLPPMLDAPFASSFVPSIPRALLKLDESPQVVGAGQFGAVVEGVYNGAPVVLKALKASSPKALAAFKHEAELLARASKHPCVPLLLGLCELGDGRVYMVMDSAGVCNLRKALCEPAVKPLLGEDWNEFGVVMGLIADAASALRHMHAQDPPIVHNDVALRNLVLRLEDGRNRAKLTDMGLACAVPRGSVKQLAAGTRVPKWQLAPETLRAREVSPASDVFQFGNLVYEFLARMRPYEVEWSDKTVRASLVDDIVERGRRPSRDSVRAHCPEKLWQLVQECWRENPQSRPRMEQVSERLADYIERMQGLPCPQAPIVVPGKSGVGAD